MDDLKLTTINVRLDGIKQAFARSRIAFLVSTIISLSIMFGIWNRYFAWDRDYAVEERDWKKFEEVPVTKYLREQVLNQWMQNQQITASLFGIRVSASDATFLASSALIVTMIWFFWCTRRENHSIGSLLRDTKMENEGVKKLVFHGIAANLIFSQINQDDRAVFSLAGDPSHAKPVTFFRNIVKILSFLPCITILVSGAVQLTFFFLPSPFDPDRLLVYRGTYHWSYLVFVICVSIFGIGTTIYAGIKINSFQNGTAKILKEYLTTLHDPSI